MPAIATRLSPLYLTTQRLGAKFAEKDGWRVVERYTSVEAELKAARERVALADVTPHGKLHVEGAAALEAVKAAFGSAPEQIGSGLPVDMGQLYRLRHDQFYLSTPPGEESAAQARLEAVIAASTLFVTVTDQTHGLADLRLIGPASRAVLSKLCGLDFHPEVFLNRAARQTSLAKTKQLILRRDFGLLPAYTVIGAQSLSAYVWEAIMQAGHEFGIVAIGLEALRELERVAG
ncbi:MAG: sarcosine oxidase subunit gamma family protein [Chloroflexota bacterium]